MTPLEERGKAMILYYCDRCLPEVKENLREYGSQIGQVGIPDFYRFGARGTKSP